MRSGGFYPSALERGSRSEQSVNLALAEMYVQGVPTRKVIEVLQKLVGPEVSVSSTQISRCAEKLDTGLQAWRNRPLDETPYPFAPAAADNGPSKLLLRAARGQVFRHCASRRVVTRNAKLRVTVAVQSACLRRNAGISKSSMPPLDNASTLAAAVVRSRVRQTLGVLMEP